MRPSSGYKTFSGQVVYKELFEDALEKMEFYSPNPDSIVIVARPQNILQEYRCFVVDKRVITMSLYKERGNLKQKEITDSYLLNQAQILVDIWQPEDMFVLDFGITKEGNVKLIELNSFSCSGQYACDLVKLYKTVSNKLN